MMDKSAKKLDRPHNICLLEECNNSTVGSERLCALHHYQLPRSTRQALALEERAKEKDQRLIAYVRGGQPLDRIYIF